MERIPIGLLDRQRVKAKTASYDPENTVCFDMPIQMTPDNNARKLLSSTWSMATAGRTETLDSSPKLFVLLHPQGQVALRM